jgi:ribosomal protein S18 acetylase RimI-like enzyme
MIASEHRHSRDLPLGGEVARCAESSLVRIARSEEYGEIGRVTQAAWREFARPEDPVWDAYFELLGDAELRAQRAVLLVAVLAGSVAGAATVELDTTIEDGGVLEPGQANFRMLAADPPRRGRGVGRLLVEACLAQARAAGKTVATLHTVSDMAAALRLYDSFGFVRDEARDVAITPGLTLLAYRLPL